MLYGLPGAWVMFVLLLTAMLIYAFGWLAGTPVGALVMVMSYVVLAGKPRHWLVYAALYVVRGRTVLTAAAPPDPAWEERLAEAREYGA